MLEKIVVGITCMCISIIDILTLKIPDRILICLSVFLLVYSIYSGEPVVLKLCSAAGMFVLFACIYRFSNGLGFGDVKFAAVLGYVLGFQGAVYACLAGSLLGIAFILLAGAFGKTGYAQKKSKVPFAPFMSAGTVLVFVSRAAV